tara:strand:+ start:94 stop:765 length:672 start_codon:yes stop_codon:yes gene_type:complete
MLQTKSKKITVYIFLFFIIGTFNNKNLYNIKLAKVNEIKVSGLEKKDNLELKNSIDLLEIDNLFFLKKTQIKKKIDLNNLVEEYYVFKKYPQTLEIKINKTKILAQLKKNGESFLLGSNGRLIEKDLTNYNVPFIFGNFKNKNFFELRNAINKTDFDYNEIENLFFFKSGRWDIETKKGLLIKLPKNNLKESLELLVRILNQKKEKKISIIDLRQKNQVILNG